MNNCKAVEIAKNIYWVGATEFPRLRNRPTAGKFLQELPPKLQNICVEFFWKGLIL